MTNKFAIKVLTELRGYGDKFANIGFDRKEALEMAIKALEQQPSEDAISRAEALKAIEEEKQDWGNTGVEAIDGCLEAVGNLPSVTPLQKVGKWIVVREQYEFMGGVVNEPRGCKCSNCNKVVRFKSNYCPNCGAKMEVEENG